MTAISELVSNLDIVGMWKWAFKEYMPYGIFFILYGIALTSTIYGKTKSISISGFIFTFYAAAVVAAGYAEKTVQPYFLLLIGIILTVLTIRVIWK